MRKIIKDYGAVATHGSKELKLQFYEENKEKRLALISYKDGMSVNITDITDEAKELKKLLEGYLNYKPKVNSVVHSLITLPAGDCNYPTDSATKKDLLKAIEIMENSDGKHATRIKACKAQLNKLSSKVVPITTKKTENATTTTSNEKEYMYAPEDKKPTIIPLKTEGKATYEECVAKLDEDAKTFIDSNCAYVINGLKELCKVDQDFRNNVMRKDKTFGGFIDYMCKAARNGYVITYGYCSWLDEDLSLGLAIDYYNHNEEEEKRIAEEERKAKAEAIKSVKGGKANGKKKSTKKRGTGK